MKWDHPERRVLKEWSIKAFDGNLRIAALFSSGIIPILLLLLWVMEMEWLEGLIFSAVMWFFYQNTFLLKRVCATRLTEEGGEAYKWRAIPDFIFSSLPWLAGIYLILVLWGFTFSPEVGLGALVGGAGMGILYAVVFTSKDYKKDQLAIRHWKFEWNEIYEVIYDRKSHAIGFTTEDSKPHIARFKEENENFYGCRIYFHPRMAKEILEIFKSKINPDIQIKEGRIHYRTID